jgi:hypothetical protein
VLSGYDDPLTGDCDVEGYDTALTGDCEVLGDCEPVEFDKAAYLFIDE